MFKQVLQLDLLKKYSYSILITGLNTFFGPS